MTKTSPFFLFLPASCRPAVSSCFYVSTCCCSCCSSMYLEFADTMWASSPVDLSWPDDVSRAWTTDTHTQDTRKDRNISNNYKTFPRDTKNWIMVLTSHKNPPWGLKTQSSTRVKLIQYQLGINLTYCTITSKFNAQHLIKIIQINNMQVSWAFVADARD